MNRTALAILLAMLSLPVACGGGGPDTTPPVTPPTGSATAAPTDTGAASATPVTSASAAPVATAAPAGPPGPGDWAKWSHDQKLAYMKSTVMGKARDFFSTYDSKYSGLNCHTCHGSGSSDGTFKMPSADLPKLDMTPAGFKAMQAKSPKVLEFMSKVVAPQTAALLGEQPFDPKTMTGFGCLNCHTKK